MCALYASSEQLIHRRIDESGIDQTAITVGNDLSEMVFGGLNCFRN